MQKQLKLGILSTLQEKQAGIPTYGEDPQLKYIGNRVYRSGRLLGLECASVLSGIGKRRQQAPRRSWQTGLRFPRY